MLRNMRLYGKCMYERSDIEDLFKLIETDALRLGNTGGVDEPRVLGLEEWKKALDVAAEDTGFGKAVVIKP